MNDFLKEMRSIIDGMDKAYGKFYSKGRVAAGLQLRKSIKELVLKAKEFKADTLALEKILATKSAEANERKRISGDIVPDNSINDINEDI